MAIRADGTRPTRRVWQGPVLPDGNVAIDRSVFDEVGHLDEALAHGGEEVDFSVRAYLAGIEIGWIPDAVVHYRHRTTLRGLADQFFDYGRATRYVYARYRDRAELPPTTIKDVAHAVWAVLPHAVNLARGNHRRGDWVRYSSFYAGETVETFAQLRARSCGDDRQPLVHVVVPVYNGEEFLAECLDSIRTQTYANWRCSVIDNASTDSTPAIAARYAREDERFEHQRHDDFVTATEITTAPLPRSTRAASSARSSRPTTGCTQTASERWSSWAWRTRPLQSSAPTSPGRQKVHLTGIPYDTDFVPGRESCARH